MTKKELAIKWFKENTPVSHRNNPVGIKWFTLDNAQLLDWGISPNKYENWSYMFKEDDNSIRESYYLKDIFRMFFGNPDSNNFYNQTEQNERALKELCKNVQREMDLEGDTIIYTPVGNNIHTLVEKMLIDLVGRTYDIYIMDGGTADRKGTSNKECEGKMKKHSEEARKVGKHCIFISSIMGTRSWSNKYVKNIILLYNAGSFDTNSQRIARGFTPWENHNNCTIFDFRMSYECPTIMEQYLVGMLINKKDFTEDKIDTEIEKIINGSDKISFFTAYHNVKHPFKKLTKDDIKSMIACNISFRETQFYNILNLNNIPSPKFDINYSMISAIESTNIKGDNEKTIKKKLEKEATRQKTDNLLMDDKNEIVQKIKYIKFIINYGYVLNFSRIKENILNYICDNIDKHENAPIFKYILSFPTVKAILMQLRDSQINNGFDSTFIWQ